MDINREIFSKVREQLKDLPAVALLGPRQVGKTTLAREIAKEYSALYVDLESRADVKRLEDAENYLAARQDNLIIIDEVQRMSSLFPLLRSLIDRHRKEGRFLLLGSSSPELLAKSSETLAGRIYYTELHPFTWNEVKEKYSVNALWLRGGFPQMLLSSTDENSFDRRTNFISTYLEKELPIIGLNASANTLGMMLQMLAHAQAGIVNYSSLSRSLGVSVPTVQRYLEYFEGAFLIRRLQPWFMNMSKRLVRSPKIYIRDTGLFHAIANIVSMEDLEGYLNKGASWESFVVQQIISRLKISVRSYFYHTHDGTELDLILVKGIQPVLGIEMKYNNAPNLTKSTTIAAQDLKIPVLIVTPSTGDDYNPKPGITVTSFERMWKYLDGLVE